MIIMLMLIDTTNNDSYNTYIFTIMQQEDKSLVSCPHLTTSVFGFRPARPHFWHTCKEFRNVCPAVVLLIPVSDK